MPAEQGEEICAYLDKDKDGVKETPLPFLDDLSAAGETINYAASIQDKWQILPR
ncbi:MAG: hypothetical protein HY698_21520 [Deltaproteobacteria bacterium]|nr:hypothetical protein [Deltaproteobacteria bacterium]